MSVIRYDPNDPQPFILISGDVISNMDLKKAIQYHKDRRAADKVLTHTHTHSLTYSLAHSGVYYDSSYETSSKECGYKISS